MTTQEQTDSPTSADEGGTHHSAVQLTGRVSSEPEARVLPSGDEICSVRVVVRRPVLEATGTAEKSRSRRPSSDWFVCTAWGARERRTLSGWGIGDEIELEGVLRRRHYRTPGGASSLVEIEVTGARRRRA
ncbi:hypothetical protein GCM10027425_00030 [Alteromonas gracilis]